MIRTLAAALATGTCIVALATPAAAQTREYNIPVGSLKSALDAYVRQSGRQVVYRADQVRSARSPGTRGQQSAEAALAAILAGSGFTTRVDGNLVAIVRGGNGQTSSHEANEGGGEAESAEEIVVTGSLIARNDFATPAPLQVLRPSDLSRRGITTVSDALRTLPAAGGGTFGESNAQGRNPGQAAVSLRTTGAQSTLVLLDSHRVSPFAFSPGVGKVSVDLNTIPLVAVERIDVLKDGASATYGSDAVAGVINVILRRTFEGAQITGTTGVSSEGDAGRYRLAGLIGNGDLQTDGYNVYLAGEYQYQDVLRFTDREFTRSQDTTFGLGDARSNFGFPGTFVRIAGTSPYPGGQFRAQPNCPANQVLASGACSYDFFTAYNAQPQIERLSLYGRGSMLLGNELTAFVSGSYSRANINEINVEASRAPDRWIAVQNGAPVLTQIGNGTNFITLPVGNPNNPFAVPVGLRYAFGDLGPRRIDTENSLLAVTAGLEGRFAGSWKFNLLGTYSRSKAEVTRIGFVRASVLNAVLADGSYIFGDRSRNSQALYDQLSPTLRSGGQTTLASLDGSLTGDLGAWGPVETKLLIGGQFRRETLRNAEDPLIASGDIIGATTTGSSGSRNTVSGFAELSLSAFDRLEIQVAGRYEHDNSYGSSFVPKIGATFKVFDQLMIRGTYGESFVAPQIPEVQNNFTTGVSTVANDPARCAVTGTVADCSTSRRVPFVLIGNPDLRPERSTSYTFGAVLKPVSNASVSIDYFRLSRRDQVGRFGVTDLITREAQFPGRVVRAAPTVPGVPGEILYVNNQNFNTSRSVREGIDIDAQILHDVGRSQIGFTGSATYVIRATDDFGGGSLIDSAGFYLNPRWRGNGTLFWTLGSLTVSGTLNYIGPYSFSPDEANTCAPLPLVQDANGACQRVASSTTFDASIRYRVNDNIALSLSGQNLGNKMPPRDPLQSFGYYSQTYYNVLGRYLQFTVEVKM